MSPPHHPYHPYHPRSTPLLPPTQPPISPPMSSRSVSSSSVPENPPPLALEEQVKGTSLRRAIKASYLMAAGADTAAGVGEGAGVLVSKPGLRNKKITPHHPHPHPGSKPTKEPTTTKPTLTKRRRSSSGDDEFLPQPPSLIIRKTSSGRFVRSRQSLYSRPGGGVGQGTGLDLEEQAEQKREKDMRDPGQKAGRMGYDAPGQVHRRVPGGFVDFDGEEEVAPSIEEGEGEGEEVEEEKEEEEENQDEAEEEEETQPPPRRGGRTKKPPRKLFSKSHLPTTTTKKSSPKAPPKPLPLRRDFGLGDLQASLVIRYFRRDASLAAAGGGAGEGEEEEEVRKEEKGGSKEEGKVKRKNGIVRTLQVGRCENCGMDEHGAIMWRSDKVIEQDFGLRRRLCNRCGLYKQTNLIDRPILRPWSKTPSRPYATPLTLFIDPEAPPSPIAVSSRSMSVVGEDYEMEGEEGEEGEEMDGMGEMEDEGERGMGEMGMGEMGMRGAYEGGLERGVMPAFSPLQITQENQPFTSQPLHHPKSKTLEAHEIPWYSAPGAPLQPHPINLTSGTGHTIADLSEGYRHLHDSQDRFNQRQQAEGGNVAHRYPVGRYPTGFMGGSGGGAGDGGAGAGLVGSVRPRGRMVGDARREQNKLGRPPGTGHHQMQYQATQGRYLMVATTPQNSETAPVFQRGGIQPSWMMSPAMTPSTPGYGSVPMQRTGGYNYSM